MGLAEGRQRFLPLADPIMFTKPNDFGSDSRPAGAISILIVFPSWYLPAGPWMQSSGIKSLLTVTGDHLCHLLEMDRLVRWTLFESGPLQPLCSDMTFRASDLGIVSWCNLGQPHLNTECWVLSLWCEQGNPSRQPQLWGLTREHFFWEWALKSSSQSHKQGKHRFTQWKHAWSTEHKLVFPSTLQFPNFSETCSAHLCPITSPTKAMIQLTWLQVDPV